MSVERVDLLATAPMGLESVVAREVQNLGYEPQVTNGQVAFSGDLAAICRANLWLRSSDRVLVRMGQFPATTFDELFEGTRRLPWAEWLDQDARFVVNGRSHLSQLTSVPACQSVAEKAVVESLKSRYRREWFSKSGAPASIEVMLQKNIATLTLDTSGAGLHKRGYRKLTGPAPIKETLAAAMVQLSRWHPDRPLLDPCCGTGTLPIEAALLGLNLAPGLQRRFDAEGWPHVPSALWRQAREEARSAARPQLALAVAGSDLDAGVLEVAQHAVRAAGLGAKLQLRALPLRQARLEGDYGVLITNPPYGERLGEDQAVRGLYRELGELTRTNPTWSVCVLAAHPGFEAAFGRRADKNRKLYNGRIQCYLYQYPGPRRPAPPREGEVSPSAQAGWTSNR